MHIGPYLAALFCSVLTQELWLLPRVSLHKDTPQLLAHLLHVLLSGVRWCQEPAEGAAHTAE